MTHEAARRQTFDEDAEIAANIKCPTHGQTCEYHANLDDRGDYHAYAICRRCGWRKEF